MGSGDEAEAGLAYARADAVEKRQLPDRRKDHPLRDDLLHLVEDLVAFAAIELVGQLSGANL